MTMTLLELAVKGGIVMVPIAACSVGALALIVDRVIYLLATRDDMTRLDGLLRRADTDPAGAVAELKPLRGPVAALWRAGLEALPDGIGPAERAMQVEGIRQIARAERGLSVLGTIIALEPMLGFLGTIVGLIQAFMQWEQLGADVKVENLAGGMYQAMITTAAGLIVAIPAYLVYAILNARVAVRGRRLEVGHELFVQRLAPAAESNRLAATRVRPLPQAGSEAPEPQLAPPAEGEAERRES